MKIAITQIRPHKGDIEANILEHLKWIKAAISRKARLIFFPELSLTGYEPALAEKLATNQEDIRLNIFQELSDQHDIIIAIGLPTKSGTDIHISMIIFQPGKARSTYSKLQLHEDELPYFKVGKTQVILNVENEKIAPAICYESLQINHAEDANASGVTIYLASVAKPQGGIEKAMAHYPLIASKYTMMVLMSNCVGFCGNFNSIGQSAVWNKNGQLIAQLDHETESMLLVDTKSKSAQKKYSVVINTEL